MTDRECIRHLRSVRLFCSPEQVEAIDRAIAAMKERAKKERTS